MKLTTTKEKILKIADKHPESEDALRSLFPTVFTPKFKKGDWIIREWRKNGDIDIARVSGEYSDDFFIRFGMKNTVEWVDTDIENDEWADDGDGEWACNDSRVTPFRIMTDEEMKTWAPLIIKHMK